MKHIANSIQVPETFVNWLKENKVIGIVVGWALVGQLNKVTTAFVDTIIEPCFDRNGDGKNDLDAYELDVGGVRLQLGKFMGTILHAAVAIMVLYIFILSIEGRGAGTK